MRIRKRGPKRKGHGGKRKGAGRPKKAFSQDDRWEELGSDCEARCDTIKYVQLAELGKSYRDIDGNAVEKWVIPPQVKRPKGPAGQSVRKQIIRDVATAHNRKVAAYYKEFPADKIASWSDDKLKDYVNDKFRVARRKSATRKPVTESEVRVSWLRYRERVRSFKS